MTTRDALCSKWKKNRLAVVYHFSLHCLVFSKIEAGLGYRSEVDREIDGYLEELLRFSMNPNDPNHEEAKKHLTKYDNEVFSRLAKVEDGRVKYQIYRTETDLFLLSVGIINNSREPLPRQPFHEEASIGGRGDYCRFSLYYSQAMNKAMSGGDLSITDILEKFRLALEEYSQFVSYFRGEHFDLFQRLAQGKFYQLERVVDEEGQREALREKQDQLLDLFGEWKKSPSPEMEKQLQTLVLEIKELKPEFSFSVSRDTG